MLSTGLLTVAWPIVVAVGAVPAAVSGLTAHLHALRTVDRDQSPATDETPHTPVRSRITRVRPIAARWVERRTVLSPVPRTVPRTGPAKRPRTGLGTKAGTAIGTVLGHAPSAAASRAPRTNSSWLPASDARYRAAHDGHSITRDALRIALRIAGPRATELRRQLAAESATPATPAPRGEQTPENTATPDRKEAHSAL